MKRVKKIDIPTHIRITPKITYEVLFTDQFKDHRTLGEMRPNEKQIVIKNGQSNTLTLQCFIHEIIHCLSDENDAKLTEKQVTIMEHAIYRFLRLNGYL